MTRTSLAERMSRLEQQKARLARDEAKLKADQSKQRIRRLVAAGTLVEGTGLLCLDDAALYGALLSLVAAAQQPARIAEWQKAGREAYGREKDATAATKGALIVTFPVPLPTAFATRLRGAGLRWNKLLSHWEGLVDHDAIAALAGEHNGTVRRVQPGSESWGQTSSETKSGQA